MSAAEAAVQRRSNRESAARDFRRLDAVVAGAVLGPADPGWNAAPGAWSLSVDRRPAAVALPQSAEDVVVIVDFAREHGLRLAPQGTGHNAHPLERRLANSLLVKTGRMRAVEIDLGLGALAAEAGAVWMDLRVPAAQHGLAAMAGPSPDVGVVGYTLGGGISWLSRRHGLAANSVAAVELVTADGAHVRADREQHPDLFWALRGGGGSFGIRTAIELDLRPITYAGPMFWPQEHVCEVLQAWCEWTQQEQPDEIISVGGVHDVPPFPEVPEVLRGRSFVVIEAVYLGDEADGADAPLRALGPDIDTFSTIPVVALSHRHMDPDHPAGNGDGMLLGDLPAEEIDAFVDAATGESGSALLSAEIRQLGGAIARPARKHGALGAVNHIRRGHDADARPPRRGGITAGGSARGAVSLRRLVSLHELHRTPDRQPDALSPGVHLPSPLRRSRQSTRTGHDPVQSPDSSRTMTDPHDSRRVREGATRQRRALATPLPRSVAVRHNGKRRWPPRF